MSLKMKLILLAQDLSTVEASVIQNDEVLAYSHQSFDGDTVHWVNDSQAGEQIARLQATQVATSTSCRMALLGVSYSIFKGLF